MINFGTWSLLVEKYFKNFQPTYIQRECGWGGGGGGGVHTMLDVCVIVIPLNKLLLIEYFKISPICFL